MIIIIIRHLVYYIIRGKPESFNIEKLSSISVKNIDFLLIGVVFVCVLPVSIVVVELARVASHSDRRGLFGAAAAGRCD